MSRSKNNLHCYDRRKKMNKRHPASRYYIFLIVAIGLTTLGYSILQILGSDAGHQWIILASLTIVTGIFTLKIPGIASKISLAETISFALLILFGPAVGAVTAALDGLTSSLRSKSGSRRLVHTMFNVGGMTLSMYVAGLVFFQVLGRAPLYASSGVGMTEVILPMLLMALTHYLINSLSIATVIALDERCSLYGVWSRNLIWSSSIYLMAAVVAALVATTIASNMVAVFLVLIPWILVVYVFSRLYLYRAKPVKA